MMAALLDHLWQSTLFALAAGLLTLVLRGNGAHTRYWLWFAASAKFLVPFSLLVWLGALLAPPAAPEFNLNIFVQEVARPFSGPTPVISAPTATGPTLVDTLLALWAVGAGAVLVFWLVRWLRVRAMLHAATPLAVDAPLPVKASDGTLEPGLIGIWRPVLVLPDGMAEHLSPDETQTVIAHELCHLRRQDNLTAAIHMLTEALFWFHPLVWWLGARLIDERERACDEAVVASGNDAEVYAGSILKVCKFYLRAPLTCTAGISGADLKLRIESIMNGRIGSRLNAAKKLLLSTAGGLALALPVLIGVFAMRGATAEVAIPSQAEIAQRFAEQAQVRTAIAYDARLFDKFAGYYELAPGTTIHAFREGDHLFIQVTAQPRAEVFPESQTKFFLRVVPAQFSFNSSPDGRATSMVVHQNGYEQTAVKISDDAARQAAAALAQRIASNTPSPGTEASVRRYIERLEKGDPDYENMTPAMAAGTRPQMPMVLDLIHRMGALKSLTFKGVAQNGWDVYNASFEHGQLEWRTAPLTADGKVAGRVVRPLP